MREPTEEQMTVNERRKYLKGRKRFSQEANRAERSRLLREMEQVTGLHPLISPGQTAFLMKWTPQPIE